MTQCGGGRYCGLETAVNIYIYLILYIRLKLAFSVTVSRYLVSVRWPSKEAVCWNGSTILPAEGSSKWLTVTPTRPPHPSPLHYPRPLFPLPEFIVCETVCLECASLQNFSFVVYSDGRFGGFLTVNINFPPSTPSLFLQFLIFWSILFFIQFNYNWLKFPHDIRMLNGSEVPKKKFKQKLSESLASPSLLPLSVVLWWEVIICIVNIRSRRMPFFPRLLKMLSLWWCPCPACFCLIKMVIMLFIIKVFLRCCFVFLNMCLWPFFSFFFFLPVYILFIDVADLMIVCKRGLCSMWMDLWWGVAHAPPSDPPWLCTAERWCSG